MFGAYCLPGLYTFFPYYLHLLRNRKISMAIFMQTQAKLIQSYIVYSLGLDIYHSFSLLLQILL